MQFVPNEQITVALAPICTIQVAANSIVTNTLDNIWTVVLSLGISPLL